jgi:hypothetical protein
MESDDAAVCVQPTCATMKVQASTLANVHAPAPFWVLFTEMNTFCCYEAMIIPVHNIDTHMNNRPIIVLLKNHISKRVQCKPSINASLTRATLNARKQNVFRM